MDLNNESKIGEAYKNKALKASYKFLAIFAFNENTNQEILFEHYELFLKHFKKSSNNYSHLVLFELFRNNKKNLIYEVEILKEIVLCIINKIEDSDSLKFVNVINEFFEYFF